MYSQRVVVFNHHFVLKEFVFKDWYNQSLNTTNSGLYLTCVFND